MSDSQFYFSPNKNILMILLRPLLCGKNAQTWVSGNAGLFST